MNELFEIGQQLKKETINIVDVINNIDEINSTQEDMAICKKKTISSINTIKRLYEKKEGIQKSLPGTDKLKRKKLARICRRLKIRGKRSA